MQKDEATVSTGCQNGRRKLWRFAVVLTAIFFARAAHLSQLLQRVVPELGQEPTGR